MDEHKNKKIFDVTICDPVSIDLSIFSSWLQGLTDQEANTIRYQAWIKADPGNQKFDPDLLYQDTVDQYLCFALLKPYFQQPHLLESQLLVQLPSSTSKQLIEMFYHFDEDIAREIIGRNWQNKPKKDLDEKVGEKVKKKSKIVKRQYENVRRINRAMGHAHHQLAVYKVIQSKFCLSKELAQRYASISFLCHHSFDTSQKKFPTNSYREFESISSILLEYWTSEGKCLALDSNLINDTRDLKALLYSSKDKIERYKGLVVDHLIRIGQDKSSVSRIEERFGSFMKAVLFIGGTLSQSKEFRDFFVEMSEKLMGIIKNVSITEIREFFQALITEFDHLNLEVSRKTMQRYSTSWKRYLRGIGECVVILLQSGRL